MAEYISKNILIEDLIDKYSFSVQFLMEKGVKCIVCGEPIWGTLEYAAKEKGFTDTEIDQLVNDFNFIINGKKYESGNKTG